ncbi:hypothetical protein EYF80_048222 [Liparis tanakae]|uniref:Uncharacterized protein n=1 Tax=Liparis tanakae TaxID=230148 RepID=A0A4Z2FK41_9TELE|nr:hypothetical protein EYF80_048222 [Liparis tanakae]
MAPRIEEVSTDPEDKPVKQLRSNTTLRFTHSAAETNRSSCPSFSSRTSLVRDSPVDCRPMTMHCGGGGSHEHRQPDSSFRASSTRQRTLAAMQRYLKKRWWDDQNWPHRDFLLTRPSSSAARMNTCNASAHCTQNTRGATSLKSLSSPISSTRNATPEKLSCRAMYMPLTFMSMATISMAPTPLFTDGAFNYSGSAVTARGEKMSRETRRRANPSTPNKPLLDGVQEVFKGPEGRALAPDSQAAHVEHRLAHLCGSGILSFVAFVENNLRGRKVKGPNIADTDHYARSTRRDRKDTTPSKSGLHQSRICLILVRCCPPAWLSPISAEYVANRTPSEVAVSPYLIYDNGGKKRSGSVFGGHAR